MKQQKVTTGQPDFSDRDKKKAHRNDSSQEGGSWKSKSDNSRLKTSQKNSHQNFFNSKSSKYPRYEKLTVLVERYAKQDPTLIRGKIRMLPGREAAAFVTCDRGSLSRDVVIDSVKEKNRSLDGDLVFCELLPLDENTSTEVKIEKQIGKISTDLKTLKVIEKSPTWQEDSIQASLWDPQVEIPKVNPNENSSQDQQPQYHGRVIYVVPPRESAGTQPSDLGPSEKRDPRRTIVGTIHSVNLNRKNINFLRPNNRSMADFLCPADFKPSGDGLYKAEYIYGSWKESHKCPACVKVQKLGVCNIHNETLALLAENGISENDFERDVLKDVQDAVQSGLTSKDSTIDWKPTAEMYKERKDYRQERIFTIDPTTARDLDDALHIKKLPDGRIELGVHIADVSHFVQPDSQVDREASRRATTVYLVDRVIPMLPRPLCEVACSLNENVERLAFSCVWKMNIDGTLQNSKGKGCDEVWYGRSVIKSCARLDYATAQNIIDDKFGSSDMKNENVDEYLWPMSRRPTGGHTMNEVASDVRLMHKVAMARRRLRFGNGALALNGVKLAFRLDSDGETPMMCTPYPVRDSNRLVEEYMLLANYLVAQRLIMYTEKFAVLRHHPPPLLDSLQNVVEIAKHVGFHIDSHDSQSLQESLNRLGRECKDDLVMKCITELLVTPMQPAEYIVSGDLDRSSWRHFALNIPYYTHFTSPIRRYADIMVHRLLQATIDGTIEEFAEKSKLMQYFCNNCNEKKLAAKNAQDRSDRIFLALYLKKHPLRSKLGIVISVGEKTFKVFIEEIGCSGMLFLDEHKEMLESTPYKAKNNQKRIKLKRKGNSKLWSEIDIKVFTKLTVSVVCNEKSPINIKIKLEGPWKETI